MCTLIDNNFGYDNVKVLHIYVQKHYPHLPKINKDKR